MNLKLISRNANEIGRNCDFKKLIPQRFSIPPSFIYYMAKNPTSPCTYRRMVRTCKFFYSKNPVLVVDDIEFFKFDFSICRNRKAKSYYNLAATQISCKFWVSRKANIFYLTPVAFTILRDKMFRIKGLYLGPDSVVLDNILRPEIARFIKDVRFCKTILENADGTLMSLERIFEYFANLKSFEL